MVKRLDEMIDPLPDGEAMTTADQEKELASLTAELEVLERQEEALIEAAFAHGVDILRRSGADPACVLGVRLRVAVTAPGPPGGRRPRRRRRPSRRRPPRRPSRRRPRVQRMRAVRRGRASDAPS